MYPWGMESGLKPGEPRWKPEESSSNETISEYVLQKGAFYSLWVIGTYATYLVLTYFESALKPLVMAFLFVFLVEGLVEHFEHAFVSMGNFLRYILKAICVGVKTCCCYVCKCKCCCRDDADEDAESECSQLKYKRQEWSSSRAGKNTLVRIVSVTLAMLLVGVMFYGVYLMILANVSSASKDIQGYSRQIDSIVNFAKKTICNPDYIKSMPLPVTVKQFVVHYINTHQMSGREFTQSLVGYGKQWLAALPAGLEDIASGFVFFLLYVIFLLLSPIHIKSGTHGGADGVELQEYLVNVMGAYFRVKTLSNTIFGTCVYILLFNLGIGLPMIIALISFTLAFIPEIGAIISMILPVPLIFIAPPVDQHGKEIEHPTNPFPDIDHRLTVLVYYIIVMLAIKMLVSNMLESYMISKNPVLIGAIERPQKKLNNFDWRSWSSWKSSFWTEQEAKAQVEKLEELHPVLILFAVVIWGEIWGNIGSLISVPMVSFGVTLKRVYEKKVLTADKKPKAG